MSSQAPHERIKRRKLKACVAAARRSMFDQDPGPDDPSDHAALLSALERLGSFPGVYQELAIKPLRSALERIGPEALAACGHSSRVIF